MHRFYKKTQDGADEEVKNILATNGSPEGQYNNKIRVESRNQKDYMKVTEPLLNEFIRWAKLNDKKTHKKLLSTINKSSDFENEIFGKGKGKGKGKGNGRTTPNQLSQQFFNRLSHLNQITHSPKFNEFRSQQTDSRTLREESCESPKNFWYQLASTLTSLSEQKSDSDSSSHVSSASSSDAGASADEGAQITTVTSPIAMGM